MGIGEKFKEERIRQGFSLDEVEEDTKIRKYYLDAIENDNYIVLPPKVYAVGFVKRYAKFLGLNEHEYSELFKNAVYGSEPSDPSENISIDKPTQLPSYHNPNTISWKNVLVALVFLITVIWAGDYLITYFTKEHNLPPNSGNQPIVQQPTQPQEQTPIEDNKPEQEQMGVEIVIKAQQNCWLNVIVDDISEYNAILTAGENLTFNGTNKIYVKAGNAGGITITYNGEEMSSLGEYGEVKEATYTPY